MAERPSSPTASHSLVSERGQRMPFSCGSDILHHAHPVASMVPLDSSSPVSVFGSEAEEVTGFEGELEFGS